MKVLGINLFCRFYLFVTFGNHSQINLSPKGHSPLSLLEFAILIVLGEVNKQKHDSFLDDKGAIT